MNITMNELLLLGNKKIKFGEGEPNKTASAAPVPETTESQSGMNALMFQGMQNLMSNPGLAQQINANGVSFKGMTRVMKTALPAALVVGAASLQSCKDADDLDRRTDININVENTVTIDFSILQSMLDELKQLRKDMADRDAQYQTYFNKIVNMYETFLEMYREKTANDEKFQKMILDNQSTIIALLEMQGVDNATAISLLYDILNSNKSMDEKLAAIKGLVSDIKSQLNTVIANQEAAAKDRAKLLNYVRNIDANVSVIAQQGEKFLESDSIMIANQEAMLAKLDVLDVDMNANSENLAKQLGIQHAQLMGMLMNMGYTQAQIAQMTTSEIIKAIKENTAATKAGDEKLAKLINTIIKQGYISEAQRNEIISLLDSIDGKLDAISANILKLYNSVEDAKKKFYPMFRDLVNVNKVQTSVLINMGKTLEGVADDVAALKANSDSLIVLANEKPDEIIEAIKKGDAGIMAVLRFNGISQQEAMYMSTQAIINAINNFKKEYITNEEKENNQRLVIIELLQNPVYNTNEGVIKAISEVTAAINAGNSNLTAELEKLYQKLAEIEAKLTPLLSKLSSYIDDASNNWKKLFDYMDKAQKAAAEDHAQMNAYLKLANIYLEKLLKAADGIKENTDSINNLGGGNGITAADLDALLDKYATKINNNNNNNINKLLPLLQQMANDLSKLDKTDDPDYTMLLNQIKEALDKLRVHEGIQGQTQNGITP